jgi:Tol biopolymer transport system component/TolB-like protein
MYIWNLKNWKMIFLGYKDFRMKKMLFKIFTLVLVLSSCAGKPSVPAVSIAPGIDDLDAVIRATSDYLNGRLPGGIKLVFLNFQSEWPDLSEYVIDGLIENTVNDGAFTAVDRQNLALVQQEMNFQLSGEVSDESAQAIGKMLGAQTIVSGAVSQIGDSYRLRVRAIGVETAEIQGQFNRDITTSARLAALTANRRPSLPQASYPAGSGVISSGQPATSVSKAAAVSEVAQRGSGTSVNYEKFTVLRTLDVTNWSKFALKPDGKFVVVNTNTGLKLCDVETGKVTRTIERYLAGLNAIVFSPDGQRFITVVGRGSSNTIRITLLETGAYREFTGHTGIVGALAYSPDGKFFVSGSSSSIGRNSDNTVKMWDAETGQEVMTITGHSGSIQSVAISPDGTQIASADTGDATIKFWNAANGAMLRSISIQERGTRAFASLLSYSPDGLRLAAAIGSRIKIYDTLNGREVFTLTGHNGNVTALAFNPEGSRLISGSGAQGKNIRIWNVTNGWETGSLDNGGGIRSLALSPDGTFLVVGGYERIKIWGEK